MTQEIDKTAFIQIYTFIIEKIMTNKQIHWGAQKSLEDFLKAF